MGVLETTRRNIVLWRTLALRKKGMVDVMVTAEGRRLMLD